MEQSDRELIRQTLLSIVKRIDEGGSTAEPPVVLVVLGSTTEKTDHGNQISHPLNTPHPGFERFPLAEPRAEGAPKSCFMEPDRVCVNSGACEMLGH